ncbi:hypothetical protein CONCODRAFT_80076 [Conidiobolus coronatus NRRL 28638]|uniref:Uncharacterized protein n=1 Tax=Conidiobolus coronatus (strain ATCC 28846 / CBS 209.66 / NRRL 28638) TaxID=796925 RepID=A0A137NXT1_CONC2|nr:hypothetical protein CONCODRAFT_80076 [Conidiobolus coronatus NRRL 28638]|eukprot:KXN67585.1 hypothetical protein CONCODRAFT_80076 [Conidiobolus coronatus NRRL 28638]
MAQENFISESDLSELTDSEESSINQTSQKDNVRVKDEDIDICISSVINNPSNIQNSSKDNARIKKETVNKVDNFEGISSISNSANPDSNSNYLTVPGSALTNTQNINTSASEKQNSKTLNSSSASELVNSTNQTLVNQASQTAVSKLTNETNATNGRGEEVFRRVRQLESTIDLDKWNLEQLKEPIDEVEIRALEVIYLKRLIKLGLRAPHLKCLNLSSEFLEANKSMVPEMSGRFMSNKAPEIASVNTKITASDQLKKNIKATVKPAQIQTRPPSNNISNFTRQPSLNGNRRPLHRHSPVHSPYQQQAGFQFQNRPAGPPSQRPRGGFHNNGPRFPNNQQQSWINSHHKHKEYFNDNDQYHPIQHFDYIMDDLQGRNNHNQQQHYNNQYHHNDQYHHQYYNPQHHYNHNNHVNY